MHYKTIIFILLVFSSLFTIAQKRVSADVEIKQLRENKVIAIQKSIYYQSTGRLVVHFTKPRDYYMVTNLLGETKIYLPDNNEVMVINDPLYSSKNELLFYFLSNQIEDLGLKDLGFSLSATRMEENQLVKTYVSNKKEFESISKIEMVFENYLPIYCAYFDKKNQITRKIYYSEYLPFAQVVLPTRITEISYNSPQDSVIKREIYSNIQIDKTLDNHLFDYEIPVSAKLVSPPAKK